MKVNIKTIQEAINSKPCPHCGKKHEVTLTDRGTDVRPLLTCSFSEDTCEDFENATKAFVAKKYADAGYPVTML